MACPPGASHLVWLTQALASSLSTPFQYVSYAIDVHPDGRVLTCAVLATLVTAGLCGLVPIRDAVRTDPREVLGDSPTVGRLPGSTRALRAIVAMQFALSTALLTGAALLIRTYHRAASSPPAFHAAGVVAAEIDLAQLRGGRDADTRLAKVIVRRLSDLPGVAAVGLTRELPGRGGRAVRLSPVMDGACGQFVTADEKLVSAHFFETLGPQSREQDAARFPAAGVLPPFRRRPPATSSSSLGRVTPPPRSSLRFAESFAKSTRICRSWISGRWTIG